MARSTGLDVDRLLRTTSVHGLRDIVAKTENEIEDKNNKLREVVGSSYRSVFGVVFLSPVCTSRCMPVATVEGLSLSLHLASVFLDLVGR